MLISRENPFSNMSYYYNLLYRLCEIIEADSKEKIYALLSPSDVMPDTDDISLIKEHLIKEYKKNIQDFSFDPDRSDWNKIIQEERFNYPKWTSLFEKIPDALSW